jgi:hypothetical protein
MRTSAWLLLCLCALWAVPPGWATVDTRGTGMGRSRLLRTADVSPVRVTLRWHANQEPDLAGYRLYYGSQPRSQAAYATAVSIADPGATVWSLELEPGTYYFALTAVDASGNESGFSNEVNAVIPPAPGKPGTPLIQS